MQHTFNVELAEKYGVDEAIVLNNFGFWIHKNQANDKNYHDDMYWTFNSIRALKKLFPYWSIPQLKRIIKKLIDKGALKAGNYNRVKYDQTKWYTIIDPIALIEYKIAFSDNGNSIFHIGTFESTESENGKYETRQPIPDSKQDSKPDSKTKDSKQGAESLESVSLEYEREQIKSWTAIGGNWIMENWEEPTSLYSRAMKKFDTISGLEDLKLDFLVEVKKWEVKNDKRLTQSPGV